MESKEIQEKQNYVMGFLFSDDYKKVALTRKKLTNGEEEKLNGIGGEMFKDETPSGGMRRAFIEKAGLKVLFWNMFGTLSGEEVKVHCFRGTADLTKIKESKNVQIVNVDDILNFGTDMIKPNLQWLLPMALDKQVKVSHTWLN